ncbi:MAG: hypothetical protein ACOCRK_01000 [bacterium]
MDFFKPRKIMNLENGVYRVACSCIKPQHDIVVWFDYNSNNQTVKLNIKRKYVFSYDNETKYDDETKSGLIFLLNHIWFRVAACFKILFFGYIEFKTHIIFEDPEHIESFLCALKESKKCLSKKRK